MTKPWRNITTIWSDKKNCVFVFISVNLTGDSTVGKWGCFSYELRFNRRWHSLVKARREEPAGSWLISASAFLVKAVAS